MKNNVGILTHWSIPNYGSFLQAYALQKVISEMFPEYDVKQIAYMNSVHAKMYYGSEIHEIFRMWLINPHFYQDVINRYKSKNERKILFRFLEYYLSSIPHTEELTSKQLENKHFDTLVLGSDILWDYSISFYNHDPYVFGNHIKAKNKISYAASFGTVKTRGNHPNYVKNGLSHLNAISVRDENSVQICEELVDTKVKLVLDPTLLWSFNDDKNIKRIDPGYKYIVVYGSYFTNEQIDYVRKYATDSELKIIYLDSYGDKCNWCDFFIPAGSITPFEWCSYIRYSEFLITCTFHGLMFGLLFNKRIIFNATSFMRDKATEFIKYLELDSVLLSDSKCEDKMKYVWDYAKIQSLIDVRKKESLAFLKKNL